MNYVGIDPGQKGGIAVLDDRGRPTVFQLDKATDAEIVRFLRSALPDAVCVIERVSASPQMGVTSAFTFGKGFGILQGAIAGAGVPYALETPNKWQTALRCKTGGDKNVSKAAAQRLFPTLKITHAIADALLIATYCKLNAASLFPQVEQLARQMKEAV